MSKINVLFAAVAAALVSSAAMAEDCKPAHQFPTVSPGALTVGGYELPPYISVKDGKFSGIDADIVNEIAAMECLKINVVSLDPSAVVQAVLSGKADLAVGSWYRTVARAKVLGLSAPLYLDQMAAISKDGIKTVSGLEGKKLGNIQGFLWYDETQKLFGDNATSYPNSVTMAQDLQAGRIDVGLDSYVVATEAQKKGGYQGFKIAVIESDDRIGATKQPGQSGFPYTKNNAALGAALDADIEKLHADGKIKEILKSHGLDPSAADTGAPRLVQ